MRRTLRLVMMVFVLLVPISRASAFSFGADLVLLGKILAQNVQQLIQLQMMVQSARNNLGLLKEVHKGIHNAFDMLSTLNPEQLAGMYGELRSVSVALDTLQREFGGSSPEAKRSLKVLDDITAEALVHYNQVYSYTKKVDRVGQNIKAHADQVSGVGAQKLSAKSLGTMIHVMNEGLRTDAKSLKLQAAANASANKSKKDYAKAVTGASKGLEDAMRGLKPKFEIPEIR